MTPPEAGESADEAATETEGAESEAKQVIEMLQDLNPRDLKEVASACEQLMKSASGVDDKTEVPLE